MRKGGWRWPSRDDLQSHLAHAAQPSSASRITGRTVCRSRAGPRCAGWSPGVTASRALIEAAIDAGADAILVHHGLFWRGHDGRVTGWMKQRLELLLAHDINLFAYHLPLDAHPELGNNAQLGSRLGLRPTRASASRTSASSARPARRADVAGRAALARTARCARWADRGAR